MNIEDIMNFDEQKAQDRYVELARGACADESYVKGDEVIIKSKGQQKGKLKLRDVCSSLWKRIDYTYQWLINEMNNLDLMNIQWEETVAEYYNDEKKEGTFLFNYMAFIITCEKINTKLKSSNPEYLKLKQNITKKSKELHSKMSKENIHNMWARSLYNLLEHEQSKMIMSDIFNEDTTFSIDDAYALTKEIIPKSESKDDKILKGDILTAMPTELVKKLEKGGYLRDGDIVDVSPRIIEAYGKDLNYEGKYLSTKTCITAYLYGLMDLEHLKKNFNITGLFNAQYLERNNSLDFTVGDSKYVPFLNNDDGQYTYKEHADLIMQVLDDVKPHEEYSQGFWNYYMNGILTREQVEKCAEENWMYIPILCNAYLNSHKVEPYNSSNEQKEKRFYEEVDFLFDDDEKVFEFFTPEVVAECLIAFKDYKEVNKFINYYMKDMYAEHGINFSDEIYKAFIKCMDEEKYSIDKRVQSIIDLYTDNYIGINQIISTPMSEEELEELRKQGIENRLLVVDLYNNNLVNQDEIFEKYEEDEVIGMINRGMSPTVLEGYYGTQEIINFIKNNKINNTINLACLRPSIDIEVIKKMYQAVDKSDKKSQIVSSLSYDDLNMLVTYGLITKEEADAIDQAYDYKMKVDQLIEQGLIVGDKNGIRVERGEGDGDSVAGFNYGPGKFDENDKQSLYLALDDEFIELELNSDVLKNYSLVIMPKDKIAIMEPTEEGSGASYVMSIKLALNQISNNEKSDGSEIVDPLKEYQNRTGIRSIPGMETVNHVENWGYNLQKKMEKIHPNMDELIYSKCKDEGTKNKHRAEIESIQLRIQQKYLQARESARNIGNVEVE